MLFITAKNFIRTLANFLERVLLIDTHEISTLKLIVAKKGRPKVEIFPYQKTFQDFDFKFQPSINNNEIMDLKYLKFIDNHENIIFVATPRVGMTHCTINRYGKRNKSD